MGKIIPKSVKCIHSAAKACIGIRGQCLEIETSRDVQECVQNKAFSRHLNMSKVPGHASRKPQELQKDGRSESKTLVNAAV